MFIPIDCYENRQMCHDASKELLESQKTLFYMFVFSTVVAFILHFFLPDDPSDEYFINSYALWGTIGMASWSIGSPRRFIDIILAIIETVLVCIGWFVIKNPMMLNVMRVVGMVYFVIFPFWELCLWIYRRKLNSGRRPFGRLRRHRF